jgi:hypothetical protein
MLTLNSFYYLIFSTFVFYQQLHARDYKGDSKLFGFLLTISSFLGMIVGLIYLFYFGYHVTWWAPIVMILMQLVFTLEKFINKASGYSRMGELIFSLIGLVIWPLFAYLMFTTVPI